MGGSLHLKVQGSEGGSLNPSNPAVVVLVIYWHKQSTSQSVCIWAVDWVATKIVFSFFLSRLFLPVFWRRMPPNTYVCLPVRLSVSVSL